MIRPQVHLPPGDGSLVFKGPQNDRQKAVVGAFQESVIVIVLWAIIDQ